MDRNFPRLLVATEFQPNAPGGGAAVVRQMLKDWPVDRLFWWSSVPDKNPRFGQQVAAHRVALIPQRLYPHRRLPRQKSWLLERFWKPWALHHFRKTLSLFKPDVVWVIPVGWTILPIAEALPFAEIGFHVTVQDYPDCKDWVKPFGLARARRMTTASELLYSRATTRDATSHPMIEDLRMRTGSAAAQMLHAGLEKEDFDYLLAKPASPTDKTRIAYAGTISREDDFSLFVQALDAIRSQLSKPVSLEIFSSHSYRDRAWFDPSWMHDRGQLAGTRFIEALRECTWGFAMMSLAEDDLSHRLSFPTKFISYLAAGLPVFTFGDSETSVVKMAQKYRVGICATSGEEQILRLKVLEAFSLENPWKTFGTEILRCGREEFDAASRRQVLYDCFRICARKTASKWR